MGETINLIWPDFFHQQSHDCLWRFLFLSLSTPRCAFSKSGSPVTQNKTEFELNLSSSCPCFHTKRYKSTKSARKKKNELNLFFSKKTLCFCWFPRIFLGNLPFSPKKKKNLQPLALPDLPASSGGLQLWETFHFAVLEPEKSRRFCRFFLRNIWGI